MFPGVLLALQPLDALCFGFLDLIHVPTPKIRPEKEKTHVGLTSGNVGFGTYACFTSKSGKSFGQRWSSCDTQRYTRKNNRSSGSKYSSRLENTFDGEQSQITPKRKERMHRNRKTDSRLLWLLCGGCCFRRCRSGGGKQRSGLDGVQFGPAL